MGGLLMLISKYAILMFVLAMLLLSSPCTSDNNTKVLNGEDIHTSQYIQKGREFTIFITISNPYDATITGNLSLITPAYFEVQEPHIIPITLTPNSRQTYSFVARPILFKNLVPLEFLKTLALGASPGTNKLYFNINYEYNGISPSDTCPFEILVVSSYISLLPAAIVGGLLGSILKVLTKEGGLKLLFKKPLFKKENVSKLRPLLLGVLGASLSILIQPFGKIYDFQGAMLLGAAIGYLGSSVIEDLLAR